jgi:hypothetical protein
MRIVLALFPLALLAACGDMAGSNASRGVEELEARVQALEDERAVLAVVDQLDLAVDAKEWDAVRALFNDEFQADFSSLGGQPNAMRADDLVNGWQSNLFQGKPSFHLRGGAIVAIDGDTANVVANGYAWNALPQRADNDLWEVWGRYEFGLTRSGDDWKISAMAFHAAHERGDPSIRTETLRQ